MNGARHKNHFGKIDLDPNPASNHNRPQFLLSTPIEDAQSTEPIFPFDLIDWNDSDSFNHIPNTTGSGVGNAFLRDVDVVPRDRRSLNEIHALLKPDTSEPWHLSSDVVGASFTAASHPGWSGPSSVGNQVYSSSFDSACFPSRGHSKTPSKARSLHSIGSSNAGRIDKGRRPRSRAMSSPLVCHDCDPPRHFHNPSEMKKDQLRHLRPYRCEVQDCAKNSDGFPTKNDLERHRKAVHHMRPELGDKDGYKCVLCDAPSGAEKKFWPRKDNFKSHIRRKHPEHEPNAVIEQSRIDCTMSAYDSALGSQIDAINEIPQVIEAAGHFLSASQDDTASPFITPLETELAGMGFGSADYEPQLHAMSAVDSTDRGDMWSEYVFGGQRHSFG